MVILKIQSHLTEIEKFIPLFSSFWKSSFFAELFSLCDLILYHLVENAGPRLKWEALKFACQKSYNGILISMMSYKFSLRFRVIVHPIVNIVVRAPRDLFYFVELRFVELKGKLQVPSVTFYRHDKS